MNRAVKGEGPRSRNLNLSISCSILYLIKSRTRDSAAHQSVTLLSLGANFYLLILTSVYQQKEHEGHAISVERKKQKTQQECNGRINSVDYRLQRWGFPPPPFISGTEVKGVVARNYKSDALVCCTDPMSMLRQIRTPTNITHLSSLIETPTRSLAFSHIDHDPWKRLQVGAW